MDLGASQQCVISRVKVFIKNYFELLNNPNFSKFICWMYYWLRFHILLLLEVFYPWLSVFFTKNASKIGYFWLKSTRKWCILLEGRSQCTWISFTCPTELKSSSPLTKLLCHHHHHHHHCLFWALPKVKNCFQNHSSNIVLHNYY